MNSLIDIFDLTPQEIMELINMACDIIDRPRLCAQVRRENIGYAIL